MLGAGKRAKAYRIDRQFVHGKADVQGGVGGEIRILAQDAHRVLGVVAVAFDLADHQLTKACAAPVGRGDEIL